MFMALWKLLFMISSLFVRHQESTIDSGKMILKMRNIHTLILPNLSPTFSFITAPFFSRVASTNIRTRPKKESQAASRASEEISILLLNLTWSMKSSAMTVQKSWSGSGFLMRAGHPVRRLNFLLFCYHFFLLKFPSLNSPDHVDQMREKIVKNCALNSSQS